MLVKLTAGVNFTNILQAAFASAVPKSPKRQFALLGFKLHA